MMHTGLTPRQAELKRFIVRYTTANGFSPSYDEMAAGIGIRSKSAVHWLVTELEDRGAIRKLPGSRARSIEVVEQISSIDVAKQHLAYCIGQGIPIREMLEVFCGKAPESIDLLAAIEQLAVVWERLQDGRGK